MSGTSSPKHNLVIQDKKLPSSVKNSNLNWQASPEGQARRAEALAQQNNIQGAINDALMEKKRQTGTMGMKDADYRALIGRVGEQFSKQTAFGAAGKRLPATAKTYKQVRVFKDGKYQTVMVQVGGPKE